ncbi:shikimate dehydrogenase (NADP(+)) [Dictyobacter formicarum]|uniref:Shikimate dehydrogenase (NADP(+)) n=2 Tax=Dictyobacter formicarum TaxID=2778368 RepID=A0ABQ3VTT9_9CHLR|nr:shikimate dehydrogenase (NADP(+)) [Dictyobacter formicarum]
MFIEKQTLMQTTKQLRVGLIGDPVAHSFSPRFQQPAFDALGIPARYELWHTPAKQLVERIRSLCEPDCLGANVTIPHKEAVLPLVDKIDPLAARIGAINTIVHRDDYLHGYNTDALGLLHALHEHGLGEMEMSNNRQHISLRGHTAILLGAGGAARAAAFALVDAGVEQLIILNRHLERARHLAADLLRYYDRPIFSLNDPSFLIPRASSIIINATSLGLHEDISPLPVETLAQFDPDTFIYDMIYNPSQTYLLCQARLMGFNTANGLSMLLHQGAQAFTLWTNQPAPIEIMRKSLM